MLFNGPRNLFAVGAAAATSGTLESSP